MYAQICTHANTCATSLIATNKAINAVIPTLLIFVTASMSVRVNLMKRETNSLSPLLFTSLRQPFLYIL